MTPLTQVQTEVRRAARERRFESGNVCILCGESELAVLMRVPHKFLEDHHVFARVNDGGFMVTLCRNCHWKVEENMLANGVTHDAPRSRLERIEQCVRGLAAFLAVLIEKLLECADYIHAFVTGLDRGGSVWRSMPEAA